MKDLKNITLRRKILKSGLTYKQVAEEMKIQPSRLSHLLAYDLRPLDKQRIEQAIATLKQNRDLNNNGKVQI